jgi:hypothetical protein
MDALLALRELQEARGLLSEVESARRAREILDRADLKPIGLVEFLKERGYEGPRLVRAAGSFGRALGDAYLAEHGVRPLKAAAWVEHLRDTRAANVYLEVDRPLMEATFAEWSK